MTGLFQILLFWLIGNALSLITGGYVSGNIIGMILLFAALCLRWVRAELPPPATPLVAADWLVDIGPGAGDDGGKVLFAGKPGDIKNCAASLTGAYLSGRKEIRMPKNLS